MIKKLHDERMNGKSKAARKSSLIKANFPMSKGASLFTVSGKTSFGPLRKLEPIFKFAKDLYFQGTFFLEGMERMDNGKAGEWEDERAREGTEVAVSTPAPSSPTLEDEPLSKSPDPSSKPIFSPLKIPRTDRNQT